MNNIVKFILGLLVGIVIGFILFVLFTMFAYMVAVPYFEEVAKEKRLAEDKEKKAQRALFQEQYCKDTGGTWIVPSCGSYPDNIQSDSAPCNIPHCKGGERLGDDYGGDM